MGAASLKPTAAERLLNRLFGLALRLGLGPPHCYLLEVCGRNSGRRFRTPVNLLDYRGRRYLVASRGATQWVRNARAGPIADSRARIALLRGSKRLELSLRELADEEKPEILREFLDRFSQGVQQYYPVAAGSPAAAFVSCAARYPVFELLESKATVGDAGSPAVFPPPC